MVSRRVRRYVSLRVREEKREKRKNDIERRSVNVSGKSRKTTNYLESVNLHRFENELPKCEANYSPLTPITFLERVAKVYPARESLTYGERRFTWAETSRRCIQLASSIRGYGVFQGDTVAVVAPNIPASYELHFAVPMAGAVLNAMNMRLNAKTMAIILDHSDTKLVFVDTEYLAVVREAMRMRRDMKPLGNIIRIVHVADEALTKPLPTDAAMYMYPEYEDFLARGDPSFRICWPVDEWDTISINYTSGTTSLPKGVVYHHRGAYLSSLAIAIDFGMDATPVYLWTLPMFHANGWCFPWILAALGGTNVCLRSVTPKHIFDALAEHKVTTLCGAPVVLSMIANASPPERQSLTHQVRVMTAGAPPPPALLTKMESQGFSITHAYGLTETYGPTLSCVWKDDWDALPSDKQATLKARQGVGNLALPITEVLDPKTMKPVPRDGKTLGEIMVKGHGVMKGYLKDPVATKAAFKGGWFHSGDLAVMEPDGYIRIKDRSKDIIISGGENISSIEVESVLYRHPHVLEAAVVARPDEYWGETPCAFVMLKPRDANDHEPGAQVSEKGLIDFSRLHLPAFKIPRTVVFEPLPKTFTGKVQKNVLRERAKALGSASTSASTSAMAPSKL